MLDVILTAVATVAGALVGGLVPVFAARRQSQLDLISSSFARVFEEYGKYCASNDPRSSLVLASAIEQARMLCGKKRFRSCDAALEELERQVTAQPPDTSKCGKALSEFRKSAKIRLTRLI